MQDKEPEWLEVAIGVQKEFAEIVADCVMEQGSTGIAEEADPADGGRVILKGYFANDERAADALAEIRRCLCGMPGLQSDAAPQITISGIPEEDWNKKWKSFFQPISITDTIVIKPTWREYYSRPGEIIIELDPGMAFGTGTHPSTRMCLRAIEELTALLPPHPAMLDVGTGSGILAIAGVKLGCGNVVGTDIDYTAITCAEKNARQNDVAGHIAFSTSGLSKVGGTFNMVVANILPHILIDLRDALVGHAGGGGFVVLSGILSEKAPPVIEAFTQRMPFVRRLDDEEWCCLIFQQAV